MISEADRRSRSWTRRQMLAAPTQGQVRRRGHFVTAKSRGNWCRSSRQVFGMAFPTRNRLEINVNEDVLYFVLWNASPGPAGRNIDSRNQKLFQCPTNLRARSQTSGHSAAKVPRPCAHGPTLNVLVANPHLESCMCFRRDLLIARPSWVCNGQIRPLLWIIKDAQYRRHRE